MNDHESRWMIMNLGEWSRISMNDNEFRWMIVNFDEWLWLSMNSHEFQWMTMNHRWGITNHHEFWWIIVNFNEIINYFQLFENGILHVLIFPCTVEFFGVIFFLSMFDITEVGGWWWCIDTSGAISEVSEANWINPLTYRAATHQ